MLTLERGDGLLGMMAFAPPGVSVKPGPRGGNVSLAQVHWTYSTRAGVVWETAAPADADAVAAAPTLSVPGQQGQAVLLARDLAAEADAGSVLRSLGLLPLPDGVLQWRSDDLAQAAPRPLWTLVQEDSFADFWADQVPRLRAAGWVVLVRPGFAHLSVPVQAWRLVLSPATGEVVGHELAGDLVHPPPPVSALGLSRRQGSWLLSLGVEIQGQTLDLAPVLADLLQRDARWLDADALAAIDDDAIIRLRLPGGKRIDAPAAPLKAIVGGMLDLLLHPRRKEGALQLFPWDVHRLDTLRQSLQQDQAARVGLQGGWQLQGDEGLQLLARRLHAVPGPESTAAPPGLGITLRPYQLQGLAWLQYLRAQHLGGILADDMGLGKTAQVLAHLLLEKQSARADLPSLVVVPTSLVFNWQIEAQRVAPALQVLTLQGPARSEDFARMQAFDLVLTSYALAWRDLPALAAQPFHLLVLDEAQMVKNAAGRSARALRRIKARHRLCMTGTPIENHLGELWAQFDFLMPGFLGDARSFQRLWRKPIEVNGESLRAQWLARRVRPFILRRRKDEVAPELPPITEMVQQVTLRGQQRDLYESLRVAADKQVRRVLARSAFAGAQISVLDALLKLRQVCCDPRLVKHTASPATMERAKLDWLREFLPLLVAQGRRVLVFSQFTEMLELIAPELDALHLPWLALTGKTPPAQRGAVVAQFQAGAVPVFLVSLKAGGVGLNLTAADAVVHVDPWWNPAVEQQATARAHRIGQQQPVLVVKLVVQGSIEDRMLELQARKSALAQGVLGSDAAGAAKFNAEDLRALLAPLDDAPMN